MSRPHLGQVLLRQARIAAAALAVTVIACGTLWIAEPAQAHDQLIESTPADGETLQVQPDEVVLQFSDELIELGAAIIVTDTTDRSWTDGDLVYDGSRARIPLKRGMPDGWYEIRWKVVSGDGHPISGIIQFAIGDAAERPPATTSPAAPTAGGADQQDSAEQQNGPDQQNGAASSEPGSQEPMRLVLIGLIAAAVAAGGYWLASRLLRRRDTHHGTDEPGSP